MATRKEVNKVVRCGQRLDINQVAGQLTQGQLSKSCIQQFINIPSQGSTESYSFSIAPIPTVSWSSQNQDANDKKP